MTLMDILNRLQLGTTIEIYISNYTVHYHGSINNFNTLPMIWFEEFSIYVKNEVIIFEVYDQYLYRDKVEHSI